MTLLPKTRERLPSSPASVFFARGCPGHRRMLSKHPCSQPSLGYQQHSQACLRWNSQKCLQTLPNVPWGKKGGTISQAESNWPRGRDQVIRSLKMLLKQSAFLLPAGPEKGSPLLEGRRKYVLRSVGKLWTDSVNERGT